MLQSSASHAGPPLFPGCRAGRAAAGRPGRPLRRAKVECRHHAERDRTRDHDDIPPAVCWSSRRDAGAVDRRVPRVRDVPDARGGDAAVDAARRVPRSRFWAIVAYNTTHVPWQGCSLHDLIQPAFSFLVGAALPFSIASRRGKGRELRADARPRRLAQRGADLARHLPALAGRPQTYWTFEDTLTQIGLGYTFLFLLAFASLRVQVAVFVGDPRRVLGGVRALSAAAGRLRLRAASACPPTGRTSTRGSSRTSTRTRTCRGRSTCGS